MLVAPKERVFNPTEVLLIKSQSDEAKKVFAYQMCAMVEPTMHSIRDPARYKHHKPSGSEDDFDLVLALTGCGSKLKIPLSLLRAESIKRFGS